VSSVVEAEQSDAGLTSAIATTPVSVCVQANPVWFRYAGGVLSDPDCGDQIVSS
jgi:hypothetical protein